MIRLVRDVASKRKTVMDALSEIGITSDTVVEKIQGVMTRSESGFLNALAETDFTRDLVGAAQDIGTTLHGFFTGSLSQEECVEALFDRGFEEINNAIKHTLSVIDVPSHVPAPLTKLLDATGATFCYEAFEYVVNEIADSLKEAREATRERVLIEQQCAEMLAEMMQAREEMRQLTEQYFNDHYETIEAGFSAIDRAILHDDIDGFIQGNTMLQEMLGYQQQFHNMDEFDALMDSDEAFKL
ncbi:MAG: hypothetical protein VZR73_09820 [Acutalibacteraceae bacterium]|nr:hypothetical protein [Acutalibacteraceae bacterium]